MLGHHFEQPSLLEEALTHRSYRNEHPSIGRDNERLEFLGDAILDAVVSHMLLEAHPDADEGELTRRRAQLVRTSSLANCARSLGLDRLVRLGRGERRQGGHRSERLLAGLFEACLGAIYQDGGESAARRLVERILGARLREAAGDLDPKSRLQQVVQQRFGGRLPVYRVLATDGPPHAQRFTVEVRLEGRVLARGEGSSKAAAERDAAERALGALASDADEP